MNDFQRDDAGLENPRGSGNVGAARSWGNAGHAP
jgi:hypothetical protein